MPKPKHNQSNFPLGMSQPSLDALEVAGYTQLEQLSQVTETELKNLHGMGPKGIRILREALAAQGLKFAEKKAK